MIDELRALHADLAARRHFTAPKQQVKDARALVAEWTATSTPEPEAATRTASGLSLAAAHDLEVG